MEDQLVPTNTRGILNPTSPPKRQRRSLAGALAGLAGLARSADNAGRQELGAGRFGKVFPIPPKGNNQFPTVVKEFHNDVSDTTFQHELEMLVAVGSRNLPNVVKLISFEQEPSKKLELSFAPGVTVKEYVDTTSATERQHLWTEFAETLLNAVHQMHLHSIYHLDLHPNNVMVDVTCDPKRLTIIDFGLSCNRSNREHTCGDPGLSAFYTPYFDGRAIGTNDDMLRRTDLFQVGSIMFLWWFGFAPWSNTLPFKGKDVEVPVWLFKTVTTPQAWPQELQGDEAGDHITMMKFFMCNPAPKHTKTCTESYTGSLKHWWPEGIDEPQSDTLWK